MSTNLRRLLAIMPPKVAPPGQVVYTGTSGNWLCPPGVFSISVVCVGKGGNSVSIPKVATYGGGGGELRYKNNIAVTPGNSYPYSALTSADTTFNTTTLVAKRGGDGSGAGAGAGGSGGTGDGGGNGGAGQASFSGGGGGAGGYSGNGGAGGGSSGAGGGGAGGNTTAATSGGGGVGLLGEGASGSSAGAGGSGGSSSTSRTGGNYGGGGGGAGGAAASGAPGAIRIIWPGDTRQFPSTNTADM